MDGHHDEIVEVLRFSAYVPHAYEALDGEAARAILLMIYPMISIGDRSSHTVHEI